MNCFKLTICLLVHCFVHSSFGLQDSKESLSGEKLYERYCKACHMGALPEAPKTEALKLYPTERIVDALESGVMSTQGIQLSRKEKLGVAFYLTGKRLEENDVIDELVLCDADINRDMSGSNWNGWGGSINNVRYQKLEKAINRENVKGLTLDWVFAFPQASRVRSQPLVTANSTFIGSQSGTIYALDTDSGCVQWLFQADSEVRGSLFLSNDKSALLFGDFKANVYSINAISGSLNWKNNISYHPQATITGSVTADSNKIYVPVSSLEVIPAARSEYECCTFRGSLVALGLKTGEVAWQRFTTQPPSLRGKNSAGALQFGPSGAPIWSSPTLDQKRGLVYVTTGQNYSSPASDTSDAVLAIDKNTGVVKWVTQVTKGDAWNGGCSRKTANCPKENGPDFDIGASAVLVADKQGKDWIVLGQKSGLVYGLDPEQAGKLIWTTRVGSGGTMGGVHWGMSSNGELLYVGVSDLPTNNPYKEGPPQPGVTALELTTGEIKWRFEPQNRCSNEETFNCYPGISAAVTSTPELVFAGGLDGWLHILDSYNGDLLWEFNSKRTFNADNGGEGFGGSIEADGPVIAQERVFVTSGYDKWGEAPGNVLLVFSLPKASQ